MQTRRQLPDNIDELKALLSVQRAAVDALESEREVT